LKIGLWVKFGEKERAADEIKRIFGIWLEDNYEHFILDLPRLKGVKGSMTISGVGTVNIPQLTYIDKDLNIGARSCMYNHCSNCLPTALTAFIAPKLTRVSESLNIDSSPRLIYISFPVLRSVDDIRINNTAAVNPRNGIPMPNLKRVHNVEILGTAPYCVDFDDLCLN
jgi:hypothetical protein